MDIESIKKAQSHKIAHPIFTGPDVEMQFLAPKSKQLVVNNVHFSKGVRCKWHKHDQESSNKVGYHAERWHVHLALNFPLHHHYLPVFR